MYLETETTNTQSQTEHGLMSINPPIKDPFFCEWILELEDGLYETISNEEYTRRRKAKSTVGIGFKSRYDIEGEST